MNRVVFFSGKQGAGKTTLAVELAWCLRKEGYRPIHLKFADPLYQMHDRVREVVLSHDCEPKHLIDGELLQVLGDHYRAQDPKFFVRILRRAVEKCVTIERAVVLVDDLRFKNEVHAWYRARSILVRLDADIETRRKRAKKWRPDTEHKSETDLDNFTDWDFRFDTTREDTGVRAWELSQAIKQS